MAQNALSRVWLGVHWRFDGLGAVLPDELLGITLPRRIPNDPSGPGGPNEKKLGGVPVGLQIADEVFGAHFHR